MIEKRSNLLLSSYCNVKKSIVILWVNFYWIQAHNRFFLGYIITDQRFLKVVTVHSQADQKNGPCTTLSTKLEILPNKWLFAYFEHSSSIPTKIQIFFE